MGDSNRIRGDVQGLRALAVITVIAAHAGLVWLPGGYVGVDVFFVVSGFLISRLLYREIVRQGRISLLTFWARRARRILPAATVVTLATTVVSLAWLSLIEGRQVLVDAVWASAFAANVHFARQDTAYFDQGLGTSPLQHYWSLAVEEQFYLVWPLLLVVCLGGVSLVHGIGARHRRSGVVRHRLPYRTLLTLLLVVTTASLAWSVVHSPAAADAAYFSTLTRAWEIGVGALAALVSPKIVPRMTPGSSSAAGIIGLTGIVLACLVYDTATVFPGFAAIVPVLGTALVLVAGDLGQKPVTARLLGVAPLRHVGDWSFSLYLWHWPALVLPQRTLGRDLTVPETLLALTVTLVLSVATYRWVEVPWREGRPARTAVRGARGLVLWPASIAVVVTISAGGWWWTGQQAGESGDNPAITAGDPADPGDPGERDPDGVPADDDLTEALVRASVEAARQDAAVPSDLDPDLLDLRDSVADVGDCDYRDDVRKLCPRGDPDGERTVVVIGDSHARAWIPAFEKIADRGGWRAFYLVKSQCTAAHVTVAPLDSESPFTACDQFQDWVTTQVDGLAPDLVVVASSPPVNGVFDDGALVRDTEAVAGLLDAGYQDLFRDLQGRADRVALLRDVPKSADDPGSCLSSKQGTLATCMFTPVQRSQRLADVAVSAAQATGTEVVDPTPWLCFEGECPVVIGGTLSYRDTDHLTTEYAASISDDLGHALRMFRR